MSQGHHIHIFTYKSGGYLSFPLKMLLKQKVSIVQTSINIWKVIAANVVSKGLLVTRSSFSNIYLSNLHRLIMFSGNDFKN